MASAKGTNFSEQQASSPIRKVPGGISAPVQQNIAVGSGFGPPLSFHQRAHDANGSIHVAVAGKTARSSKQWHP